MLITDVQERIMDVFSRATKSLLDEFRNITLSGPFQERLSLYKNIETDFKDYSLLGKDLVAEVKTNISSGLRPTEREKYINNLNTFLNQVKDGYAYLESDQWLDQIFVGFGSLIAFNNAPVSAKLTEEDKKCIFRVAEEVRSCCYEFIKAADEINAESSDPLPGLAMNMGYFNKTQTVVEPQQTLKANPKIKTTSPPIDQGQEQIEPAIKLRWNGASDTLYDVFRQLKNHHLPKGETLIEDSYDQIAQFIQRSFVGFDNVATSTIRGKLTKNNRPKKSFNRVDLDLTEHD